MQNHYRRKHHKDINVSAMQVRVDRIPRLTEHIETNLWLVESILGAKAEVTGNLVKIQGIGYSLGSSTIN